MADENKIQLDIEVSESSIEKSFGMIDDRAIKSAKSSAAVFGEYFQKQENELQAALARLTGETTRAARKSARESAQVFTEAFEKTSEVNTAFSIKGLADLAGGFFLAEKAANTAIKGIKSAIDTVAQGEALERLEKSFRALASTAGLAGDEIKSKLVGATKGLVDDTQLLELGSQAFIRLGENARKLPEILSLAGKSYKIFGGSIVDNAEKITQAVETGNARSLRSIGLNVDLEKAVKDYATRLKTVPSLLTESQIQQARMNAILEIGEQRFKNVKIEMGFSENVKLLSNAYSQLGDELSKISAANFSGIFSSMASAAARALTTLTEVLITLRPAKNIEEMNIQLEASKRNLTDLTNAFKAAGGEQAAATNEYVASLGAQIKATQADIAEKEKAIAASRKKQGEDAAANKAGNALTAEYIAKRQDLANKIQEINTRVQQSEVQLAQEAYNRLKTRASLEVLYNAQRLQEATNFGQQAAQLEKFYADNGVNDEALRQQGREALYQEHLNRMLLIDQQYRNQAKIVTAEQINDVENFSDAVTIFSASAAEAMRTNTVSMSMSLRQLGEAFTKTFQKQMTSAIFALAQGTKNGEEALNGLFTGVLNAMGEMMISQGIGFMLQGAAFTWAGMPNGPQLVSAGAAMTAFGATLAAVSAANGGAVGAGGGATGGVGATETAPTVEIAQPEELQPQGPQTAVNLTINGNVLDRRQTGLEIAQILEEQFSEQGLVVRGA